jgi:glucan-binding repeat-containing protein
MRNGWFRSDGYWYWCEEGNYVAYAEKCIDGNWYWFDADGTMARNKNVYIPEHDKWVYYGDDGVMAKEEHLVIDIQFKYIEHQGSKEHWRYFDKITGEKQINSLITCNGITRYYGDNGDHYEGERNLDGYWYYFERREYLPSETDKKLFGSMAISKFVYLADGDKWVYYDENGRMLYGEQCINGNYYYFDPTTGAMQKGNVEVSPGVTHHYDETTGIRQD